MEDLNLKDIEEEFEKATACDPCRNLHGHIDSNPSKEITMKARM